MRRHLAIEIQAVDGPPETGMAPGREVRRAEAGRPRTTPDDGSLRGRQGDVEARVGIEPAYTALQAAA